MQLKWSGKTIILYIFLTIIGLGLIALAENLGFFVGMDNYLYDLSFRVRGPLTHDKRIIIAAVNEKTLDKLGRWPLRRIYYAELLDRVQQAKVVGFDIIMAEPSPDDDVFEHSIKKHAKVVLPVYIDSLLNIEYPAESLTPHGIGHIHVEQDIDGITRKVFHTLYYKDVRLPSFTSAIYEIFSSKIQNSKNEPLYFKESISEDTIVQTEPMNINYYGSTETFQQISVSDILEANYSNDFFKDKIVLVGVTAAGLETKMLTPFTQKRDRMSGVEVHANILNNLIDKNAIQEVSCWACWIWVILVSFACFLLFLRVNEKVATVMWSFFLILITVAFYALFCFFNIWLRPVAFYFSITFVFFITYIFRLDQIGKLLFFAKEEWENTFNDINDGIIVHDNEFTIVRANRAAEEMLNRSCFETIKTRWSKLFHSISENRNLKTFNWIKPTTAEIYDPDQNKFLEIKTIPRFDVDNHIAGAIQLIRDITDWKHGEEARKKSEEELRNLTVYLHKVAEIERTTIAREIHDELGSALTVLKMDLSWMKMKLDKNQESLIERIEEMSKLIDKTVKTVKRISTDLRPELLDDLGLAAAIEWQAEEFQRRTGIICEVTLDSKDITLDRDQNTAVFRIFQETLTNIARHAEATKASVQLQVKDREIELQVRDNGRGITDEELSNKKSFGLIGIRERVKILNGNITVKGVPGKGTTVTVRIAI